MKARVLLLLGLWCAPACPAHGASPALAEGAKSIEALVKPLVAKMAMERKVPGASWAILLEGRIYFDEMGFADLENKVEVSESSMFRIGSVSKPLTSTLVMALVERKTLALTDPARKHCPQLPEDKSGITIAQLLAHLGGIRHYKDAAEFLDTRRFASVSAAVDIVKEDAPLSAPGTKYTYSSHGYNLVGCAIEGSTGQRFEQLMETLVLSRAGVRFIRVDEPSSIIAGRARGYSTGSDNVVRNAPFVDVSSKIPGGGYLSTATELARYTRALMDGKLLSPSSLQAAWSEQLTSDGQKTGYGLGWRLNQHKDESEVYHTGEAAGGSAILYLRPKQKFAFVFLGNLDRLGEARLNLARDVADAVLAAR